MLLILVSVASTACGKKGPPLAPLIKVPAGAADFTARRIGGAVHFQLTIPGANTDGTRPANVESVTIYGFTGAPASNDDFVKRGTVITRIPVRTPPPPAEEGEPPPPPPTGPGVDQGAVTVAMEEITPALMVPLPPLPVRGRARDGVAPSSEAFGRPLAGPPPEVSLARVYVAVGMNRRGQRGAFSPRITVPLLVSPSAPSQPTVTYTADALSVQWTPPADAPLPIQASTAAAPAAGAGAGPLPSRPLSLTSAPRFYNVYEVKPSTEVSTQPSSPSTASTPLPDVQPLTPLNTSPLGVPSFQDTRVEFGVERCYAVRTVDLYGTLPIESASSPPTCVTMTDTFAPAAPGGLASVPSPGVISLVWTAVGDRDLAGYYVLRGEAPGEKLQPLTPTPIRETNYNDKDVKPGTRYVYAVVAVDSATPANVSSQSNRIEETARD